MTVNVFVMLPIGACRSCVIGRPVNRSATPRDATQLPWSGIHKPTVTRGKPDAVNPLIERLVERDAGARVECS
jgi:hypothetical protein